jgi:hypothetical protein
VIEFFSKYILKKLFVFFCFEYIYFRSFMTKKLITYLDHIRVRFLEIYSWDQQGSNLQDMDKQANNTTIRLICFGIGSSSFHNYNFNK